MSPWASAVSCGLASVAISPWWLRAVRHECSRGMGRGSTVLVLAGLMGLSSLVGGRCGGDPVLLAWWWSGLCSVGLAVIDGCEHRLPRSWLVAMGLGVLVVFAVRTVAVSEPTALWRAVTAAALVWLGMRLLEAVCAGAMGAGDTRLLAVLALQLGWLSWHAVLFGLVAGTLILGMTAGFGWLGGQRAWTSRIPAGPSLLLGFWVVVFVFAP